MRLLIISHTEHYIQDGIVVGWGPTVREINALQSIFDEITHIGCLHDVPAPESSLPYGSDRIIFIPVPPTGGDGLMNKLRIVWHIPLYVKTILRYLKSADVVHVRAPANIPLIALLLLSVTRQPKARWIKYAGNWAPEHSDPWSYQVQRWLIRANWFHGFATINGKWPQQASHIFSLHNPCYSEEELKAFCKIADGKRLSRPLRILFAGQLNRSKGVDRVIEVCDELVKKGFDVVLDVAGDGFERSAFEKFAIESDLNGRVIFHGMVSRVKLNELYANAHIILFPSASEGWPKVLSEAMAFGVVPVASNVSSIPQVLNELDCGLAIPPFDIDTMVEEVISLIENPDMWKNFSVNCSTGAKNFTYELYVDQISSLVNKSNG